MIMLVNLVFYLMLVNPNVLYLSKKQAQLAEVLWGKGKANPLIYLTPYVAKHDF